jgi:hypothetical protein
MNNTVSCGSPCLIIHLPAVPFSGFLAKVCTDIIHYHNRQLLRYVGNLSEFVKAVPTAKSYYELEAATLKFRFPVPGLLDGISSKEKPICKLIKVEFTYPGKHIQLSWEIGRLRMVTWGRRMTARVSIFSI